MSKKHNLPTRRQQLVKPFRSALCFPGRSPFATASAHLVASYELTMKHHLVLALDAELNRLTAAPITSTKMTTPKKYSSRDASSSPVSVSTDVTAWTDSSSSDGSVSSIDGPLSFLQTPDHNKSAPIQKTKKRVHFGVVRTRVIQQKPPTKAEKKNLWYNAKDVRTARTEIYALNIACGEMMADKRRHQQRTRDAHPDSNAPAPLHPLVIKAGFDEIHNTWRGLEHVRQGALMLKLEHRRNFVQAFLYFTHDLGVSDPGALSVFSSTNSKVDRQRAVRLAARDAMEACQIYYHLLKTENLLKEYKDDCAQMRRKPTTLPGVDHSAQQPYGESKLWRRGRLPGTSTPRHTSDKRPFKAHLRDLTSHSFS